jgi:hypothetical protein
MFTPFLEGIYTSNFYLTICFTLLGNSRADINKLSLCYLFKVKEVNIALFSTFLAV